MRLLHISDLHFGFNPNRLPSPYQLGGMKQSFHALAIGYAGNWFHPASHSTRAAKHLSRFISREVIPSLAPSAVVVTGDLATTGSAEDLGVARRYFPANATEWFTELQEPVFSVKGLPLVVLPGNHDRYHGSSLVPGSKEFEKFFSTEWQPRSACNRVSSPSIIRDGDQVIAVIGADFTFRHMGEALPSIHAMVGKGLVHADVLRNLRAATLACREGIEGVVIVWLVHYPFGTIEVDPNLELVGREALLEAALELEIPLVLCGHTHKTETCVIEKTVVACVGSAMQAEAEVPWQFAVHELTSVGDSSLSVATIPFEFVGRGRDNFQQLDKIVHY